MAQAYILLDPAGRVLSTNQLVADLAAEVPGLFAAPGQVDLAFLNRLLEETGPPGDEGRPAQPAGPPRLEIAIENLRNGSPATSYILVSLRTRWMRSEQRRRMLVQQFRMTPAEVRLAELIMDGHTPVSASRELGITVHTVRTYLKRLYAKTGVKNQAGLVRKLLQTERA
jgi:DNA-binding CsgD family transcriptional regulator